MAVKLDLHRVAPPSVPRSVTAELHLNTTERRQHTQHQQLVHR